MTGLTTEFDPPARPPPRDEAIWVRAALVRSLMQLERHLHAPMVVVLVTYVGLLWEDVPALLLLAWAAVAFAVLGARLWFARQFRAVARSDLEGQVRVFERARWLWLAMAWVLAAAVPLFFERVEPSGQFLGWLMFSGIAVLGAGMLSPQLSLAHAHVHILLLTALATVAWHVVMIHGLIGPLHHYWLLALLVVFWQVLQQIAQRLHRTQRSNFELLHRNELLITSLTRQTRAALDAVETKNRFLASATHDIRQPVHALGLYADWLAGEPEMVHDLAPKIVESTRAVNALFDSLFDLVRLDGGGVQVKIESVSLERLMAEMEVQYRPLAHAKGLAFRVRPCKASVTTDPVLLKRVVGNLISNAIKYTQRGGVLVGLRWRAGVPCIEVWDTGVGIAPHHQRDIFQEFYKVPMHAGTEEGFGLGLYIVSRLSYILGHAVELRSRLGHGTVFRLVLASADPAAVRERATRVMGGWPDPDAAVRP
jgi:signal transduction histidine kinase